MEKKPKDVIIIGASGHGSVILDIVLKSGDNFLGFLDDGKKSGLCCDFPIIGGTEEIEKYKEKAEFVIGIGDNKVRRKISEKFNISWYTAIHPSAEIALNVKIDAGSVIMAKAVVNANSRIGKHCIINSAVVVEHDNVIRDYVHISPNATLCGTVFVGSCTHIGASTTVRNNLNICDNCTIGAGSVIVKDIYEPGVYYGVPVMKH